MSKTFSIVAALFLLSLMHVTGLIANSNLSHPFWHVEATLVGGAIGVAMIIFLFWLMDRRPGIAQGMIIVMAAAFPICLFSTWYSAQAFIESADFEWLPGLIWHKGYQTLVALFIPLVALVTLRYARRS